MHDLLTIHPSTHLVADGDTITLVHVTPTATGGLHLERFPLGTAPTSDDVLRLFDHLALTDNADIRALEWRVRSLEASDQYHRQQYEQAMTELARLQQSVPPPSESPSAIVDVPLSNGTRLTLTPPADTEHEAVNAVTCTCGYIAAKPRFLSQHLTMKRQHAATLAQPHGISPTSGLACLCGKTFATKATLMVHIARFGAASVEPVTVLPPVEPTPLPVRASDPAFAPLSPAKTRAERTRAQHHLEAA